MMRFPFHAVAAAMLLLSVQLPPAFAQDSLKYDALLWKISGKGMERPSYLYGTMHVSSKVAYHLTEQFFTALDACEVVALEMDPDQWLPEMMTSEFFTTLSGMGRNTMHGDRYGDAFALELPDRERLKEVLAQDPGQVNELLYRVTEAKADHEEDTFLDLFIFQSARKLGKPVVGLEQFDTAVTMMIKAMVPGDDEEMDGKARERMKKLMEMGKDPAELIEDAYRANDLARMDTLFDMMMPLPHAREWLIDERNRGFLRGMMAVMRERPLFTGVGALHLPGRNGLIQMLLREGYIVEAVHGRITERSRSRREKMDEQYHPVNMIQRPSPDPFFSMELPAPLYRMSLAMDRNHTLICADMTNGAYFSVQRVPTFAAMRGRSVADVMASVDSLLYESVPGRITSKKPITGGDGWPGYEIRSTTRLGRELHYRIYVTPFDIVVFKRTGRANAQLRKDGEHAFGSIEFTHGTVTEASRWTDPQLGFSVDLPADRSVDLRPAVPAWNQSLGVRQNAIVQAYDRASGASYLVIAASHPDVEYIEEDSFELAALGERYAKGTGLKTRDWSSAVHQGRPVRFGAHANANGDSLFTMTLIDGPRYFFFAARAPRADAQRFFQSVSIDAIAIEQPFNTLDDTLLHFSTRTLSVHDGLQRTLSGLGDFYSRMWGRMMKQNEHPQRGEERGFWYVSSVSPDAVHVHYERSHRFRFEEDEAAFWEKRERDVTDHHSLVVRSRSNGLSVGGDPMHDLVLGLPGSSRAIRVRMLLHHRALYTLRANIDTLAPMSAWVDSFFTSFTPTDTSTSSIFKHSGSELLGWIEGGDSALVAQADDSWGTAEFNDADAPRLIALAEKAMDDKKAADRRDHAIQAVGPLHHATVLPFLEKTYTSHTGEARIQVPVLKALLRQRTITAARIAARLLLADPPVTDEQWEVNQVFSLLHDSLELALPFYPAVFDLSGISEYERGVRNLTAALLDKGLVKAEAVASHKGQWLQKANAELKRQVNSALGAQEGDDRSGGYDEDRGYHDDEEYGDLWSDGRHTVNGLMAAARWQREERSDVDRIGTWSDDLSVYQHLLLPWYDDPGVKAFFAKCLAGESDDVVLATAAFLGRKGHPVDAGIWQRFWQRDERRYAVHAAMAALRLDQLVPDSLLTERRAMDAYLLAGYEDAAEDSIRFIASREVTGKFGRAMVYLYERREKDGDDPAWRIGCAGFLVERDAKDPFEKCFTQWADERFTDRAERDKSIDAFVSELRFAGRKYWRGDEEPPPIWDMD